MSHDPFAFRVNRSHPSPTHRAACERGLGMVTYKVVPFSPTAGLVQWVQVRGW